MTRSKRERDHPVSDRLVNTSLQCSAWAMASTITEDLLSRNWDTTRLTCCLTYRWSMHENYR